MSNVANDFPWPAKDHKGVYRPHTPKKSLDWKACAENICKFVGAAAVALAITTAVDKLTNTPLVSTPQFETSSKIASSQPVRTISQEDRDQLAAIITKQEDRAQLDALVAIVTQNPMAFVKVNSRPAKVSNKPKLRGAVVR